MHQARQALVILGVLFAFVAGLGMEHTWLPVGLAIFGVFVGFVHIVDTNTNNLHKYQLDNQDL